MKETPYQILRSKLLSVYPAAEAQALARWVMEERFGYSQTDLLLGKDTELSAHHIAELQNIALRLQKKEPIQYILGQTEFCGHTFRVAPGVLIPRPETAQLIQLITAENPTPKRILDMGTGSGCIAISLALAYPNAQVEAWDISPEAIDIATQNARRLEAEVIFCQEDILHIQPTNRKWDLIVSNPPYICAKESDEMDQNVLEHEPHLALFVPDEDPLLFYRHILLFALSHLAEHGKVYFEINQAYGQATCQLASQLGYQQAHLYQDSFGRDRMVCCIREEVES